VNETPATARSSRALPSWADRFGAVYLRTAQAYMLISMPTGTSTIFGVFQVIRVSQVVWRDAHADVELRASSEATQVWKIDGRTVLSWSNPLLS
jgi:hypothetical protein